FTSGGTLNIQNCVIRGFGTDGLSLQPDAAAAFTVSDTVVSDNANNNALLAPGGSGTVTAVFNRVEASHAGAGFVISGDNATAVLNVTIANSLASNNTTGVEVLSATGMAVTQAVVVNSTVSNNLTGVFEAGANSTTFLAKTAIAGNTTAAFSVVNSGT